MVQLPQAILRHITRCRVCSSDLLDVESELRVDEVDTVGTVMLEFTAMMATGGNDELADVEVI